MSAGILKYDRGLIGRSELFGGTWHGIPSYEVVPGFLDPAAARETITIPVGTRTAGFFREDGSFCEFERLSTLVREDVEQPLSETVSERFNYTLNEDLFDMIDRVILRNENVNVKLESVGTLWNGRTTFINLVWDKFQVDGDESETELRLVYVNRFDQFRLFAALHHIRIVCANTMGMAKAEGKKRAKKGEDPELSYRRFRHSQSLQTELEEYTQDVAAHFEKLTAYRLRLNELAHKSLSSTQAFTAFGRLYGLLKADGSPMDIVDAEEDSEEGITERSAKLRTSRVQSVMELWDGTPDLKGKIWHTGYSALQAVILREDSLRDSDDRGGVWYDGLFGRRNELKQQAFELVSAV